MTDPSDSIPMSVAPSNKINDDTPCRLCGYNLRGLTSDGRCPECGAMVSASLGEYQLATADFQWLRKLLVGVRIFLLGFVLLSLFVAIAWSSDVGFEFVCGAVLAIVSRFAIGGWLFSMPDPSGLGEMDYGTSRKIARWTLVMGTIQAVFDVIAVYQQVSPRWLIVVATETALAQIIGIAGVFSHLNYLQKFIARIPTLRASFARFLKFVLTGAWAGLYVITLAELFGSRSPSLNALVAMFTGILLLFGGVFGLGYVLFVVTFERALAEIVGEAENTSRQ